MTKKKPTKRTKLISEPVPEEAPVPVPPTSLQRYLPFIITAVFFILSLIGILHHEMWRDEFQAWMVARDAHSIGQLFQNLKYEGNPGLWHAFLYIVTAFTDQSFFMQLLHIIISAAMVFLINRHAPLTWVQKVLLTFSYFVFYEYNIISRSYGLGMLLVVSFLSMYPLRQKYLWWMAIILFLLGNCTIFGVILAGALCAYLVADELNSSGKRKKQGIPMVRLVGFAAIAITGLLLGYWQIKPEPNNSFPTLYVTTYDALRLKEAFSRIIHAYFPIPDFTMQHFWNTNLLVRDTSAFFIGFALLPLVLWMVLFWKNKLIAGLFTSVTIVLLIFYYYTGLLWSRYTGHLFVILFACYWLWQLKEMNRKKTGMSTWSMRFDKWRSPILTAMLAIGCLGGLISYILDLQKPFSTSAQAAEYLRENKLDTGILIGLRDFTVSPLATHLGREIYYAERDEPGTFIIFDEKWVPVNGIQELIPLFTRLHQQGHKAMVLVKDNPIKLVWDDTGEEEMWKDAMLTDQLNLRLLTHIEPGVVKDEDYYIYMIEEKLQ